jgi:hypothetical protein
MATWKGKEVIGQTDWGIDWVKTKFSWDFNTCSDTFCFYQEYLPDNNSNHQSTPRTDVTIFHDNEARLLFQALAIWIKNYDGQLKLDELLDNNPFKKDN